MYYIQISIYKQHAPLELILPTMTVYAIPVPSVHMPLLLAFARNVNLGISATQLLH